MYNTRESSDYVCQQYFGSLVTLVNSTYGVRLTLALESHKLRQYLEFRRNQVEKNDASEVKSICKKSHTLPFPKRFLIS
jgi:hypothetical protein